jgi:hypothetical protein
MGYPIVGHLASQSGGDVGLADDGVEVLGPVFPVKSLILHVLSTVQAENDGFTLDPR